MSSPQILDFGPLLNPIGGEQPAGEDLRQDISPVSVYYQVKDARAAARAAERASLQSGDLDQGPPAEWRTVLQVAPDVLATRSKDLEIVAWLIEALLRQHGFAGLRDGFRLARELVEGFWDGLYPTPDEDGIATRVAPLTGLNGEDAEGTLIGPIGMVPIVAESDRGPLGLWEYRGARELAAIEDTAVVEQRVAQGALTLDHFNAALASTDPQELLDLVEDVQQAQDEFTALTRALDERCGHDSPPSSSIRNALQEVADQIEFIVRDHIAALRAAEAAPAPVAEDAAGASEGGAAPAAAAPAPNPGVITTRAEAFALLKKISKYFHEQEPHSPLAYMIDRTVRWGSMPLTNLVDELIPDSSARDHFHMLTGVKTGANAPSQDD